MPEALGNALPALRSFGGIREIALDHRWARVVYTVVLAIGVGKKRLVNGDAALAILTEEGADGFNGGDVGGDGQFQPVQMPRLSFTLWKKPFSCPSPPCCVLS